MIKVLLTNSPHSRVSPWVFDRSSCYNNLLVAQHCKLTVLQLKKKFFFNLLDTLGKKFTKKKRTYQGCNKVKSIVKYQNQSAVKQERNDLPENHKTSRGQNPLVHRQSSHRSDSCWSVCASGPGSHKSGDLESGLQACPVPLLYINWQTSSSSSRSCCCLVPNGTKISEITSNN